MLKRFLPIVLVSMTVYAQTLAPAGVTPTGDSLADARQAFSHGQLVEAINLRGHVMVYTGKGGDEGSIEMTATRSGVVDVDLHLRGGNSTEHQDAISPNRRCNWKTVTGHAHVIPPSNCFTSLPWFLPQVALQTSASSRIKSVDMGLTTEGSAPIRHHHHAFKMSDDPKQQVMTDRITLWSAADLRLSPATNLPIDLTYLLRNEGRPDLTISSRTTFADYRTQSGVTLPFRIKRYLNGALVMDITVSDATIR